jgi:hypothetical protein
VALEGVSGRHALLLHAEIVGDHLYCGSPVLGESVRASYHADGKCHVYWPGGREIGTRGAPLRQLRGKHLMCGGSIGMLHILDWTYRVVPDRKHRRKTVVLDLDDVSQLASLSLWAIEQGRQDLVNEVLTNPQLVPLAHAHSDWSQPQLLVVLWRPSQDVMEGFNAAVCRDLGSDTEVL